MQRDFLSRQRILAPGSFLEIRVARILADDVREVLVVFVADVLHQLVIVLIDRVAVQRKRLRVCPRILDGDFVVQVIEIRTPIALDHVQMVGVRMAREVEPELLVEPDGIDEQRIAFPSSH